MFGEINGPKTTEESAFTARARKASDIPHYAFLPNLKSGLSEKAVEGKTNEISESAGAGDKILNLRSKLRELGLDIVAQEIWKA